MSEVPDWLQVLLAVLGLITGSSTGVYYGGVRRARLEDRRELLRVWMPWVPDWFYVPPPDFEGTEEHVDPLTRILVTTEAIDEINLLVELLPWVDRAQWVRCVDALLQKSEDLIVPRLLWNLHSMFGAFLPVDEVEDGDDRGSESEALDATKQELEDDGDSVELVELELALLNISDELDSYVAEFRSGLVRRVNPRRVSSLLEVIRRLELLKNGPRPWSRSIRPGQLRLDRQMLRIAGNYEALEDWPASVEAGDLRAISPSKRPWSGPFSSEPYWHPLED